MKIKRAKVRVHPGGVADRLFRASRKQVIRTRLPFDVVGRVHLIRGLGFPKGDTSGGIENIHLMITNRVGMPLSALNAHPSSKICIEDGKYEHFTDMSGKRYDMLRGKKILVEDVVHDVVHNVYTLKIVD